MSGTEKPSTQSIFARASRSPYSLLILLAKQISRPMDLWHEATPQKTGNRMSVLSAIRNTVVLGWLTVALLSIALTLGLWAFQLTATVATMTASAASTAIRHRKDMARAIAKTKAKARLRRVLVAVPVVGIAATAAFEVQDYNEWQEENPDKTANDYICEVRAMTAEVMDEVLQELPELIRPSPDSVMKQFPKCLSGDVTLT